MASNLPPGVTVSMLPGNRPEDIARENAEEKLMDALIDAELTPSEYDIVREVGINAVKVFRECLKEDVQETWIACEERIASLKNEIDRLKNPEG
jgi:hypothetical protein